MRLALALSVAALGAAFAACGGGSSSDDGDLPPESRAPTARRPADSVPPDELLARPPYMGVSCRVPNSVACDRIGLSVWLGRPASRVTAAIEGRQFTLNDPDWSGPRDGHGQRRLFAGFLQPAGLTEEGSPLRVEPEAGDRWIGSEPVAARVELEVVGRDGDAVVTKLRVPLNPGWG